MGRNNHHGDVSYQAVDAAIARSASVYGNIERRRLHQLGLGHSGINHRVDVGRLYLVYRAVYSVGRRPRTPIERADAAVLACGAGAALSHGSAMTLWGFWKRWEEPFEVTVPRDRRPPGIKVHRSQTMSWRDITTQLGIRTTTPARTIFDTAPRMTDKGLKRTVNNALNSPWLNESELTELVKRLNHLPTAKRIAPLIGLEGTSTRAQWEDDFPDFCAVHGLPRPVMGAPVCGYLVDALFPRERVIVELDSLAFHGNPVAFRTDRERDAETLVHGFVTVRITYERFTAQEAERLRRIIERRQAPRAA